MNTPESNTRVRVLCLAAALCRDRADPLRNQRFYARDASLAMLWSSIETTHPQFAKPKKEE